MELCANILKIMYKHSSEILHVQNIAEMCSYIKLKLHQNMIRRHGFIIYIKSSMNLLNIENGCYWWLWLLLNHNATLISTKYSSAVSFSFHGYVIQNENIIVNTNVPFIGGGRANSFSYDELMLNALNHSPVQSTHFKFHSYVLQNEALSSDSWKNSYLIVNHPLHLLIPKLAIPELKLIALAHGIFAHSKSKRLTFETLILNHVNCVCPAYISVFEPLQLDEEKNIVAQRKLANLKAVHKYQKNSERYKQNNLASVQKYLAKDPERHKQTNLASVQKYHAKDPERHKQTNLASVQKYHAKDPERYKQANLASVQKYQVQNPEKYKQDNLAAVYRYKEKCKFPPCPPSQNLQQTIIHDFCQDISPNIFMESGCCICGKLTPMSELQKLSELNLNLDVLNSPFVTQKERFSACDSIEDLDGPVMIQDLDNICNKCHKSLSQQKRPLLSLANGLWIGNIPAELSDLTYVEQLLIARVRHNRCIVRVSSGMHKMRANAIVFANPTPKIYNILPPPVSDLDDVLAFIYTGPCKPTKSDFERTPLLVRRNKVATALNWLKLNNFDYYDLEISLENLNDYPENGIPVVVDYRQSSTNKNPESTAVHDNDTEDGTETGMCPFVVHGLTGEEYSTKSLKAIKAIALKHFEK